MVTATIVKTFSGIEMGQDRLSNKNNLLADMEGFRAATLNYAMKASQSGLVLRTEIQKEWASYLCERGKTGNVNTS